MEQELTDRLNAPVVFAHNDLLSGNLMHNEEEGKWFFSFFFFLLSVASLDSLFNYL